VDLESSADGAFFALFEPETGGVML